jgi:hypothetical protein
MIYNYCKYIDNQVPSAGNFLYNFDYFLNNRLMTPVEEYGLRYVLSHNIRNLNLIISIYSELYYDLYYDFNSKLATIKTYISSFLGEIDTHKECINSDDAEFGITKPSVLTPNEDCIEKIVRKTENLIPVYNTVSSDLTGGNINEKYYTTICNNNLVNIAADILREGMTANFIRNCVILYGANFFNNITQWLDTDANFNIFIDQTNAFFALLYEYDLLLGRSASQGVHQEIDAKEISSIGNSIAADKVLAKAELIRKQSSY